jgi:hypothetical protein
MVAIIIVTWYLYGRAYYMGPIRALTSWTEGSDDKYRTATGRARAIQEYARREKGLPSMSDITVSGSGTGGTTETTSKGSLWKSTLSSAKKFIPWPSAPSAARAQLSGNETGAIPESELLPTTTYAPGARTTDIALQESQLFPDVSRHQPATASHVSEAIPLRKLSGSTGTQHGY